MQALLSFPTRPVSRLPPLPSSSSFILFSLSSSCAGVQFVLSVLFSLLYSHLSPCLLSLVAPIFSLRPLVSLIAIPSFPLTQLYHPSQWMMTRWSIPFTRMRAAPILSLRPLPYVSLSSLLTVANPSRLEIKGKTCPQEARRLQSRSQETHSDDSDQQIVRETRCLQETRQTGQRR